MKIELSRYISPEKRELKELTATKRNTKLQRRLDQIQDDTDEQGESCSATVVAPSVEEKFMPGMSQHSGPIRVSQAPQDLRVGKAQKSQSILITSPYKKMQKLVGR